jgi:acetyl-CoA synthetase
MPSPRQAAGDGTRAPAWAGVAHACCARWAADRGRLALYHEDAAGNRSAWSFWDIQREANRLSNVLAALGVARGDCVALASRQRPETAVGHIACYQTGASVLPLSPALAAEELAPLLERAAARVAILDAATLTTFAGARDRLARRIHVVAIEGAAQASWARAWSDVLPLAAVRYAPARVQPDDAALRIAGEGGAADRLVTQRALLASAADFAAAHGSFPQPGDLFWTPADWGAAEGLCAGLLAVWSFGQPILGYSGAFDPETAFRLIERYGVKNLSLSPARLELMMAAAPMPKTKYELELRSIVSSGPVTPPVAAWAREELGVAIGRDAGNEEAENNERQRQAGT